MPTDHRAKLATIKRFDQLIAYLRDEMDWPIEDGSAFEDLTFEYLPEEIGIDPKTAAKIQEIKRLRPLSPRQPWGIYFVKFEPKKLPVVALRRILSQVALKKRASANSAERADWAADDLLFVSNYGEGEERQISFAHFSRAQDGHDLPTLKVLGWDNRDTALHLDAVARELTAHLAWPDDDANAEAWRTRWRAAFTLGHREVVTTSKELSIRLAEMARNIRDRIKTAIAIETDKGPLTKLMKAFQTSLVHDLDADGFADMYAQTIAYGLLSARIADPNKKTADDFAAHMRTNPFLRELMETFLKVGGRKGKAGGRGKNDGIDFDELGVSEVVELLDAANMEAVVRDFGDRNPQEDPVIHFYELFLKEYDAKKRMQRGVFYTPRPVVSYIVRSVDELLRTEFGLADGLADTTTWGEMAKRHKELTIPEGVSPDQDFVQILDPATGTGTFLVEVIDLIHKTLVAKWKAQGHGERKIDALWNEYVPTHLLTRLHGYELLMAPYAIAHLKIGLKLYETGYRFGSDERARVYLTNALEPAQDFSGRFEFAIPALAHEAQAVNTIKRDRRFSVVIGNPPYSNFGRLNKILSILKLLEDYKRGLQEKKLNLDDDFIKFMRFSQYLLDGAGAGVVGMITNNVFFDGITHRRMRESLLDSFQDIRVLDLHGNTKKLEQAPDGSRDVNVFEIQQGVGISLMSKTLTASARLVSHAELWGQRQEKYELLQRATATSQSWTPVKPSAPNYFFVPKSLGYLEEYEGHALLTALFRFVGQGIQSKMDGFAIRNTREEIVRVTHDLKALSIKQLMSKYDVPETTPSYSLHLAQRDVTQNHGEPIPIAVKPFDQKWTYFTGQSNGFLARPRAESTRSMLKAGIALVAKRQSKEDAFSSIFVIDKPINEGFFAIDPKGRESIFPLRVSSVDHDELFRSDGGAASNVNRGVLPAYAMKESDLDIVNYAYATLHSRSYRTRYKGLLKIDFPRVPFAGNLELFRVMAGLGGELVALHLLESPKLDRPVTEYLGGRTPEVEKVSWSSDTVWLDKAQTAGFKGVREEVWNFHIGGYQVCEKWLKDRKGRALSADDLAHYQKIVVALAETIRLMQEIDEVIEQHGGWPGAFQTSSDQANEPSATYGIAAEPSIGYDHEEHDLES